MNNSVNVNNENNEKKQTVTKFRAYATIDREEIFLNEMCAKGWKLVRIIFGAWFVFEKCQPGEYIARVTTCVDPAGHKAGRERRERLAELLTESGAEIVPETNIDASTRIYAVRRADAGDFEINTDIDSLIAEYTGRRKYHIITGAALLAFFVSAVVFGSVMVNDYLMHPNDSMPLISAGIEFFAAFLELMCSCVALYPVPAYTKKIKELRSRRAIEE